MIAGCLSERSFGHQSAILGNIARPKWDKILMVPLNHAPNPTRKLPLFQLLLIRRVFGQFHPSELLGVFLSKCGWRHSCSH
jgi:hypothetical protein